MSEFGCDVFEIDGRIAKKYIAIACIIICSTHGTVKLPRRFVVGAGTHEYVVTKDGEKSERKTNKITRGDNKGAILAVCFVFRWFGVFRRTELRRGVPEGQVTRGMLGLSSSRHSKGSRALIFALSEKDREGTLIGPGRTTRIPKKTRGKGGDISLLSGVLVGNEFSMSWSWCSQRPSLHGHAGIELFSPQ